jgi:hypothetical protein
VLSDALAKPAADATVSLTAADGHVVASSSTDASDSFTLAPVVLEFMRSVRKNPDIGARSRASSSGTPDISSG